MGQWIRFFNERHVHHALGHLSPHQYRLQQPQGGGFRRVEHFMVIIPASKEARASGAGQAVAHLAADPADSAALSLHHDSQEHVPMARDHLQHILLRQRYPPSSPVCLDRIPHCRDNKKKGGAEKPILSPPPHHSGHVTSPEVFPLRLPQRHRSGSEHCQPEPTRQ